MAEETFPSITAAFLAHIARDMRNLPAENRKQVRPALKRAGGVLQRAAQSNASWSTRIPGAITVRTSFRRDRESVAVVVNKGKAPHARPYEGIASRGGTFRHPVFGDGNRRGAYDYSTWASEPTRPFLLPAADTASAAALVGLRLALNAAAENTVTGA